MSKPHRTSFAVAILTALGVLPVPAESTPVTPRDNGLIHVNPIDLEQATVVKAVKTVHDDIRAGRLGH